MQPARRVRLLDVKVSAKPLAFDSTETGFVDFAFRLETVMVNAFGRGARACLARCATEKQLGTEEDNYLLELDGVEDPGSCHENLFSVLAAARTRSQTEAQAHPDSKKTPNACHRACMCVSIASATTRRPPSAVGTTRTSRREPCISITKVVILCVAQSVASGSVCPYHVPSYFRSATHRPHRI